MIESKKFDIHGHEYIITTYPGTKGLQILIKLTKYLQIISEPLKKLEIPNINAINISSLMDSDIGIKLIAELINQLPTVMGDDFTPFVKDLLSSTIRDTKDLSKDECFNDIFAGNYGELFAVMIKILQVNYGGGIKDFFTNLAKKGKAN